MRKTDVGSYKEEIYKRAGIGDVILDAFTYQNPYSLSDDEIAQYRGLIRRGNLVKINNCNFRASNDRIREQLDGGAPSRTLRPSARLGILGGLLGGAMGFQKNPSLKSALVGASLGGIGSTALSALLIDRPFLGALRQDAANKKRKRFEDAQALDNLLEEIKGIKIDG